MRFWLLALLIALLPLRSWAADAMALSQWGGAAPINTPTPCHESAHPEAVASDREAAPPHAADTDPNPHGACDTCDVCHANAMAALPQMVEIPMLPRASGAGHSVRFASALSVGEIKPPIA